MKHCLRGCGLPFRVRLTGGRQQKPWQQKPWHVQRERRLQNPKSLLVMRGSHCESTCDYFNSGAVGLTPGKPVFACLWCLPLSAPLGV
jgi:hypothetical protein